ncbi:hypothetical protein SEA_BIG4_356 [Microbacterium phage Big4]|nr:hypothetical protein SEA_BIG4_30 [Microbacterium phage Big4]URP22389.1 hypothetical protein SEA_BIG4_356 [Microbacterium phage Big4]
MRDFDIDGHMISAPTLAAAKKQYVDTYGVEPEDVYEYEPDDVEWDDPADSQAAYDDQWGDPLEMPSYAS